MELNRTSDEATLRRKLLFRLLRDFDFDHPKHRYEMITSPVSIHQPNPAPSHRA